MENTIDSLLLINCVFVMLITLIVGNQIMMLYTTTKQSQGMPGESTFMLIMREKRESERERLREKLREKQRDDKRK